MPSGTSPVYLCEQQHWSGGSVQGLSRLQHVLGRSITSLFLLLTVLKSVSGSHSTLSHWHLVSFLGPLCPLTSAVNKSSSLQVTTSKSCTLPPSKDGTGSTEGISFTYYDLMTLPNTLRTQAFKPTS